MEGGHAETTMMVTDAASSKALQPPLVAVKDEEVVGTGVTAAARGSATDEEVAGTVVEAARGSAVEGTVVEASASAARSVALNARDVTGTGAAAPLLVVAAAAVAMRVRTPAVGRAVEAETTAAAVVETCATAARNLSVGSSVNSKRCAVSVSV